MHQRFGLVQQGRGEGDAETDRDDGESLAPTRLSRVPAHDFGAPLGDGRCQRLPAVADAGTRDAHPVGKGVALAQQVLRLQDLGRDAKLTRGGADRGFDDEDSLRRAEAAEGRVRRQIGAAAGCGDAHVGDEVGVGCVEQRAFEDRCRQVGAPAGVLQQPRLVGDEAACVVEPDPEIGLVGVALAGDRHVVAALGPTAYRPAEAFRGERGEAGPQGRLLFLAAEAAAEALDLDLDQVHRQSEDRGDGLLRAARRLRRRMHADAAVVARQGQRALRLQVDVLGRADVDFAADHRRAGRPGGIDVAEREGSRRLDQLAGGEGRARVEAGGKWLPVGRHQATAAPGPVSRIGDDQRERLADAMHLAGGKQRFVVREVADLVGAGNVGGGEYGDDARLGERGRNLDPGELCVRMRRNRRQCVQAARRQRQVAREARAARGEQFESRGNLGRRGVRRRAAHDRHSSQAKSGWSAATWSSIRCFRRRRL